MISSFDLRPCLLALAMAVPETAPAQSLDLGLNFAEVTVLATGGGLGDPRPKLQFSTDFRAGEAVGVQLDLSGEMLDEALFGQVDLHLYLAPQEDRIYGFYGSLADMDGRELTVAHVGVEGLWSIGQSTFLEARAGMGMIRGLRERADFIAVTGAIDHAFSDRTSLFAALTIAEFEETRLQAITYDGYLGLRHSLLNGRVDLTAVIGRLSSSGRDAAPAKTIAMLGVTWRFAGVKGQMRGVAHRGFSGWQPIQNVAVLEKF